MTWKEFKEEAERQGVQDDTRIHIIDVTDPDKLRVRPAIEPSDGVDIFEV